MFGQLVPCGGGDAIRLRQQRAVIGRAAECDIKLPFGTVSAKHCLLELRDGVWFVVDLASRNGIRVDGAECKEARLSPGSILSIADYRYRVVYTPGAQVAAADESTNAPLARTLESTRLDAADLPTAGPAAPPLAPPVAQPVGNFGELIPCGGGVPIPLRKAILLVGRSASCDIKLPFPKVSGKHCQLELQEGFWHVRDLGSTNGVRVDGVQQAIQCVKPGAILSIAEHRYQIAYTPPTSAPVAESEPKPERPGLEPSEDPEGESECVLDEAPAPVAPEGGSALAPPVSNIENKKRWIEEMGGQN